jgi:shikimate dehydrogenase
MHNAAFATLGIDAVYVAFDVPPRRLGEAIAGARALGVRQLSISIPHKVAVMQHLDEVEATARRIGAVNTVTLRGERMAGTNTDWLGAMRALEREVDLSGKRAVVLGAGGTARALVHGLLERGVRVAVLNRTVARARALASELGAEAAGSLSDLARTPHDLLVNTTAVGLRSDESPVEPSAIAAGSVVMDAVYEPERTRLLCDAESRGARPVSGKWMLVYQAAEQIALWTGREAPVEAMADAFDRAGKGSATGTQGV